MDAHSAIFIDAYVRVNRIALEVWADDGQSEFNGVNKRTLDAFVRRGLVWYQTNDYGRHTGGLTPQGRDVLQALERRWDSPCRIGPDSTCDVHPEGCPPRARRSRRA